MKISLSSYLSAPGKKLDLLLRIMFLFLPVIMLVLLCAWKGFHVTQAAPLLNDEVFWYNQTKSFIEYGRPLGYWGYDQTHAAVGTYAAWGPWLIWLMAIFPSLFHLFGMPLTIFTFILGNMTFMVAAHGIFLLLTKPDRKKLFWLLLASIFLYSSWLYIFTAMAEILRFSIAIILAGMFLYVLDTKNSSRVYPVVLYLLLPLALIYFTLAHLIFTLLFPVWFYVLWKRNCARIKGREILWGGSAIIGWLILSLALAKLYFFVASPFPDYGLMDRLDSLKEGILPGLISLLSPLLTAWKNLGISSLIKAIFIDKVYIYPASYVIFYYLTLIILAVCCILSLVHRNSSQTEHNIISFYVLAAFLGSIYLLYIQDLNWTLLRHLSIPVTFCLYFLAASGQGKPNLNLLPVILSGVLLFYPFSHDLEKTFLQGRDDPALNESRAQYLEMYSQYMEIDPEASPWENTVVMYRDSPSYCSDFPTGTAINLVFNLQVNTTARYAIVCKDIMPDVLEDFTPKLEQNHTLLYEDDRILFYRRN